LRVHHAEAGLSKRVALSRGQAVQPPRVHIVLRPTLTVG
jgi:hypothetical protein